MRYKFDVESCGEILEVRASFGGEFDDPYVSIVDAGLQKVIVDLTLVCRSMAELERFFYASRLAKTLKSMKVALIMLEPLPPDHQLDTTMLKVVQSHEEALLWLE